MAKKGKKRQLNEDEAANNQSIEKKNDVGNKDLPKNKKLKTNADDSAVVKTQNAKINSTQNVTNASKKPKNTKNAKKEVDESSTNEQAIPSEKNEQKPKNVAEDNKDLNNKKKDKFKQKRKQNLEQRKVVRQEDGQHSSINKLSVEELKTKIAEIESRETVSKTALRKLRVLKKKLNVEEGTTDNKIAPKRKNENEEENVNQPTNKKFKKDDQSKVQNNKDENTNKNKKLKKNVAAKNENKITDTQNNKEGNVNKGKKFQKELPAKSEIVKEGNKTDNLKNIKKGKKAGKNTSDQVLFVEDRVGKKPTKNNEKKNKDNKEGESEVDRAKKILEVVLKDKQNKAKKVQNSTKDDDDSDEEYKDLTKALKPTNDTNDNDKNEEDEDDSENDEKDVIVDEDDNDDDDNNDDDSEGDNNEDDEDDEEKDEEEEPSESVESSTKKLQNTPFKKETKQGKPSNEFNKQKPNQINQNDGAVKNQRYVLFVGNLAYDATTVDIKKHFLTKVEKIKDVRIPTKPGSTVPRGFAYVEFENSTDYEKALSLHDTFINGRKINVQYTSSGSKHISGKQEIVHKNKKLHALRKAGVLAGSQKNSQKRSFRRKFDQRPKN